MEEKKAQPATSPNSMQEYSPTVTGETKQIKIRCSCSVSFPIADVNLISLHVSVSASEGLEESSVSVSISEQLLFVLSVSPSFFNLTLS